MADFVLIWKPNPSADSQTPQYREQGDSVWIDTEEVSSLIDTYTIEGLSDDIVYEFRIKSVKDLDEEFTDTESSAKLTCPPLSFSITGTELAFSFTPASDNIDTYTVQLFKNGIYNQQLLYNTPFTSPVSGTFTGLTADNLYQVRLKVKLGDFKKTCEISSTELAECASPTDIVGALT